MQLPLGFKGFIRETLYGLEYATNAYENRLFYDAITHLISN